MGILTRTHVWGYPPSIYSGVTTYILYMTLSLFLFSGPRQFFSFSSMQRISYKRLLYTIYVKYIKLAMGN